MRWWDSNLSGGLGDVGFPESLGASRNKALLEVPLHVSLICMATVLTVARYASVGRKSPPRQCVAEIPAKTVMVI